MTSIADGAVIIQTTALVRSRDPFLVWRGRADGCVSTPRKES